MEGESHVSPMPIGLTVSRNAHFTRGPQNARFLSSVSNPVRKLIFEARIHVARVVHPDPADAHPRELRCGDCVIQYLVDRSLGGGVEDIA